MNADEQLLADLLGIPSPTGHTAKAAEFLASAMAQRGFAGARVDEAGNAVGWVGRGPRTMYLVGHLDTVPGDLPVRVSGREVAGRGAVDAKGSLVAFVAAAGRFARDPRVRLLVAGCCDEEGASEGATHLLRTLPPPEALLIGEPSGVAGVTLGYKGIVKVRYTLEADAVHTGTPEPTVADRGMAFWRAVQEQVAAEQRADSLFRSPSARLLRINTSEAPGGRVRMALEGVVRTPPGFDLEGFEAFLQRRADGGAVHIPETEPAWEGDRNSSVARALTAAVRARGLTPRHLRKTGTSDANLLAPAWGVPCAAYGPGDAHLDHTPHERLALAEFREAVEVLGDAIERFAAWGGDPTRTDP